MHNDFLYQMSPQGLEFPQPFLAPQTTDSLSPQQLVVFQMLNQIEARIKNLMSLLNNCPDNEKLCEALSQTIEQQSKIFDKYIELENARSKRVAEVKMKEAETGQSDSSSTEEI